MNAIFEKFKQRGLESGGELYLRPAEAREFLEALRAAEFTILGVEAVRLENGKILPLIDQIADFSSLSARGWHGRVELSSRAAAAFLDQLPRDHDIMVTFTALSRLENR